MTKEEAINVLAQALEVSAKAGVFSLSDAATIVEAIKKVNELVEIVPTEE
jgi:hypothetical protein